MSKILSVCGISGSGKTTTIEYIIRELTGRGYKVGSVKEIHFQGFTMDPNPASNTNRHRNAGAQLVCARGLTETNLLFPGKLPMQKILEFYAQDYDYVVLEGVTDICVPTISTACSQADLNPNDTTFCISGVISATIESHNGIPAINALTDIAKLVDLIEQKAYAV